MVDTYDEFWLACKAELNKTTKPFTCWFDDALLAQCYSMESAIELVKNKIKSLDLNWFVDGHKPIINNIYHFSNSSHRFVITDTDEWVD